MKRDTFCRVAPFALFMAFIAVEEGCRFFAGKGFIVLTAESLFYLYPLKVFSVALLLFLYRKSYTEISFRDLGRPLVTLVSLLTGIMVFIFWVNMDFPFATIGKPQGFNPTLFQDQVIRICMIAARISGAVLVVPLMEELFWRSFLIRYIVDEDFSKVPLGLFTWSSFLITAILFGLEHNLFLAGIMAGIVYNLLLYYTRSISHCIVAHAVTNLALGVYVISTGHWRFW
jgi:CAAX prenyl protease-like protein